MNITTLRIKVLHKIKSVLKIMLLLFISVKKIFENMPYKSPILLILDLPRNAGTQTGCTWRYILVHKHCLH